MENKSRNVFHLNGVSGMLIATILLLSILAGLTIWGIKAQQDVMQAPYSLQNLENVKMNGSLENEHKKIASGEFSQGEANE